MALKKRVVKTRSVEEKLRLTTLALIVGANKTKEFTKIPHTTIFRYLSEFKKGGVEALRDDYKRPLESVRMPVSTRDSIARISYKRPDYGIRRISRILRKIGLNASEYAVHQRLTYGGRGTHEERVVLTDRAMAEGIVFSNRSLRSLARARRLIPGERLAKAKRKERIRLRKRMGPDKYREFNEIIDLSYVKAEKKPIPKPFSGTPTHGRMPQNAPFLTLYGTQEEFENGLDSPIYMD